MTYLYSNDATAFMKELWAKSVSVSLYVTQFLIPLNSLKFLNFGRFLSILTIPKRKGD
jgi:hypothetical protein